MCLLYIRIYKSCDTIYVQKHISLHFVYYELRVQDPNILYQERGIINFNQLGACK